MFSDETMFFGDHGEVPRKLWSSQRNAPFRECMVCNRALGPEDCYEIQKAFNKCEAVIEIVVCMECGLALAAEYSRESIAAITAFMQQRLDFSRPPEVCTFCGAVMGGAPSQSLSAVCRGDRLIMPVIGMCAECEERLQGCLSEKTRRAHEDFINRTVPGIPADLDLAPVLFL